MTGLTFVTLPSLPNVLSLCPTPFSCPWQEVAFAGHGEEFVLCHPSSGKAVLAQKATAISSVSHQHSSPKARSLNLGSCFCKCMCPMSCVSVPCGPMFPSERQKPKGNWKGETPDECGRGWGRQLNTDGDLRPCFRFSLHCSHTVFLDGLFPMASVYLSAEPGGRTSCPVKGFLSAPPGSQK